MEIPYEIYSFQNRRKGPIIRANSKHTEDVEVSQTDVPECVEEISEISLSPSKVKKHKKKKLKKSKKDYIENPVEAF